MNKKINQNDFWNAISVEYSSGRTKGRKYILEPALFSTIGNMQGKKVLDVGCGAGDICIPLAQQGAICTGIDYADKLIDVAKARSGKLGLAVDFRVMDVKVIEGLPLDYDIAIIALLFPHVPTKEDIAKTVKGVASVLKPNGRLVIAEPHPAFDYYMRNRLKNGNYRYFQRGFMYDFIMEIGDKSLQSQAYHWTLADYSDAIAQGGLTIQRIVEPQPIAESQLLEPEWYQKKAKYPPYIILDCVKNF